MDHNEAIVESSAPVQRFLPTEEAGVTVELTWNSSDYQLNVHLIDNRGSLSGHRLSGTTDTGYTGDHIDVIAIDKDVREPVRVVYTTYNPNPNSPPHENSVIVLEAAWEGDAQGPRVRGSSVVL